MIKMHVEEDRFALADRGWVAEIVGYCPGSLEATRIGWQWAGLENQQKNVAIPMPQREIVNRPIAVRVCTLERQTNITPRIVPAGSDEISSVVNKVSRNIRP